MSLHSYSSVVKRIDKRAGSLSKFLSLPRNPMQLKVMNHPTDLPLAVHAGVRELAARTAGCYQSFANPVFTRSVKRANAERLRWVQRYSLREFKYCVALQEAVAQFEADGGVVSLAPSSAASQGHTPGSSPGTVQSASSTGDFSSFSCFVRNTDDHTYVDEPSAAAPTCSSGGNATPSRIPSTSVAGSAEHLREVLSAPCGLVDRSALSGACGPAPERTSHDRPLVALPRSDTETRRVHETRKGPMTREESELALETGDIDVTDLPFDIALEMLRPQQSVLDVLVNEASLQSEQLNTWFSLFCRRRVAWRVLHEHLLHLIRPDLNPPVIHDNTDVIALLQGAGNTVADIYAKLNISDSELVIHLEEDASILTTEPVGAFVTSSVDCVTRAFESGPRLEPNPQLREAPPISASVYSVEGHLGYVFREVLKNACVATVRWTSDVSLLVRFAVDDRWVVVDVVDHASGIAPEHMRQIWKFGWTTSEHYESHLGGFGVGLPTSKVYMDMWGGSISVYSTVGKGTTVRVRYPKSPTEILVPSQPQFAPDTLLDDAALSSTPHCT